MQVTRQYHSTALLLPDGRVLSAGGGICGTCDTVGYLAKNAEVFTPPYLFKADGSGDPAAAGHQLRRRRRSTYATPFEIATPDAAAIRKLALVRLGAVTHSVNMDQRYVPLSFTAGSGTLTATAPRNANIAPPGVYMLFAIDANGVPSMAKMVTLKPRCRPGRLAHAARERRDVHRAGDREPRGHGDRHRRQVAKVEFFNGATKLGEDTTAPYSLSWTGVPAGLLLAHRPRDRQPRSADDQRGDDDHGRAGATTRRPRASRPRPTGQRSRGIRTSPSPRRPPTPAAAS